MITKRRRIEGAAPCERVPQPSQRRDVLSAHQAAKLPSHKQPEKPQPRKISRAEQQLQEKRAHRGIPDIREIHREEQQHARPEQTRGQVQPRNQQEPSLQRRDVEYGGWGDDVDPPNEYNGRLIQLNDDDAELDVLQATPKVTRNRKKKARKSKKSQGPSSDGDEGQASDSNARPPNQIGGHTPYSRALLKRAKLKYRELIFTIDPFPSDDLWTSFGQRAWKTASEAMPSEFNKSLYFFSSTSRTYRLVCRSITGLQ